jgi:uncharacterized membrane protein YcaP (DUF421 family)
MDALIDMTILLRVLVRTLAIFIFAFALLRMLGKKHLAHMTYLDLLLVISMGSAVGDVMIYDDNTTDLVSSLVALITVAILVKVLSRLSSQSAFFSRLVAGTARVVAVNGKLLHEALKKEELSEAELMTELREKGYESLAATRRVFVEPDGEISIVPKQNKTSD